MEKKKRPRTLPRVRTIIQAAVFIFVFLGANVAALGKLGIAVPCRRSKCTGSVRSAVSRRCIP